VSIRQKILLIFFGISLFFILLEVALRVGGGLFLFLQESKNYLALRQKNTCRIMCLGESTTAGEYPRLLGEILNQRSKDIKFSVINKGVVGANTSSICAALDSNIQKYQPDIIITMMGINDNGNHLPYEPTIQSKPMIFLKSLRTYKLIRLLWLHMINKFGRGRLCQRARQRTAMPSGSIPDQKATGLASHNNVSAVLPPPPPVKINPISNSYVPAEAPIKEAPAPNSNNGEEVYLQRGEGYLKSGNFSEAETSFKTAVELNAQNPAAYMGLGMSCMHQVKIPEAEAAFRKVLDLSPDNEGIYWVLGCIYQEQGKYSQAEELFNKAIELDPGNTKAYIALGWNYIKQGKYSQAEAIFTKSASSKNVDHEQIFRATAMLYNEMGNTKLAKLNNIKANELKEAFYEPATVNNYLELWGKLKKRNIRLICVQYPMRSIAPLKKIFEG